TGQRPGSGGPDEQPLALAGGSALRAEREPDEHRLVGALLVAFRLHLVVADRGPAAPAPGDDVAAAVDEAALVAALQEGPDRVVVLVAEGEVGAADLGGPQPANQLL